MRDHRLMVELGVVQSIEHVDSTRPARGKAHTNLAVNLACAVAISSCQLLARHLHDVESLAAVTFVDAAERTHDSVDAVAGIGEDATDAPRRESLEKLIGDGWL